MGEMPPEFFKSNIGNWDIIVSDLFNTMAQSRNMPNDWEVGIIFLIFKS